MCYYYIANVIVIQINWIDKKKEKKRRKARNVTKMNFEVSFQSSLVSGLFSRFDSHIRHCLMGSRIMLSVR